MKSIIERLQSNLLVLDGATGTYLQQKGMPIGVSPELWATQHIEILKEIQSQYVLAGADILYAFTFGANRKKLANYKTEKQLIEINHKAVSAAQAVSNKHTLIAGDIGPTGQFIEPIGALSFDEAVEIFTEQINALVAAGVDLIVIETMVDIQEARAALLAAKRSCNLPVIVSMTYENGRTLTGTDPKTALYTLQSMGADVIGTNCSAGPDEILNIIKTLYPHATVPLLAKPNAGIPELRGAQTIYNLTHQMFQPYISQFIEAGTRLLGGCCGTTPEFICAIKKEFEKSPPLNIIGQAASVLTTRSKTLHLNPDVKTYMIGDRINPSGKKQLKAELKEHNLSTVKKLASEQVQAGTDILDINVSMSFIDEKKLMGMVVKELSAIEDVPFAIDSFDPEVIEEGLKQFPGRAIINSVSGEPQKMEHLLKIAQDYGAMIIIMPVTGQGVPESSQERLHVIQHILDAAKNHGLNSADIIVDALVLSTAAKPRSPKITLDVINKVSTELNLLTMAGLSNVSFGLPQRDLIDAAFLAMCIQSGMNLVNINPSAEIVSLIRAAADVLVEKDKNGFEYIQITSGFDLNTTQTSQTHETPALAIQQAMVKGDTQHIIPLIQSTLATGTTPSDMLHHILIPTIQKIGDQFEDKRIFLPQLIMASKSMEAACHYLNPMLAETNVEHRGTVLLASVKGDIHDIGKNIVGLMLKNYGFIVHDLGKDISAVDIVEHAQKIKPDIIGLSALMTTTTLEMGVVVQKLKEHHVPAKIILGGPIVDKAFTDQIKADDCANNSHVAVKKILAMMG